MPGIGSSGYPFASDCFSLIRSMLNDADIPFTVTIPPTGAVRTLASLVTITANAPHNLQVGNTVQVQGVSNASFNGTQVVTAVPTANSFQYNSSGTNVTSGNGIVSPVVQGDVYTDAVLTPLVNRAYRKVQQRLQENGSPSQKTTTQLTLPAGTTQLLDTTNPPLPADFLSPRTIRERISGQPFYNSYMSPVPVLPSLPQQAMNYVYLWMEDGLYFPGALGDTDIELSYNLSFPPIVDGNSQFTIRGSLDPIAAYGAFLAVNSRNPSVAAIFKSMFDEDMKEFLNQQAHSRQYNPARRRPNNLGRRGTLTGWGYTR